MGIIGRIKWDNYTKIVKLRSTIQKWVFHVQDSQVSRIIVYFSAMLINFSEYSLDSKTLEGRGYGLFIFIFPYVT